MSELIDTAEELDDTMDSSSTDGVYANAEKAESEGVRAYSQDGDSSDEVDPRKLYRDPTLSEIRWYYRRTFAKVLVDKPIDDAFKNSFEFNGDNEDEAQKLIDNPRWDGEGDGYIGAYRLAEKKARRDGFALIFMGTMERNSDGIHVSPISENIDVKEVSHLKVLTIDDLASTAPHDQIQEGTGLDEHQYEVRPTGIVINTDISSPDYRTPVGYVLGGKRNQFIHADRVQHLTWNPEVDGDYKRGRGVSRYETTDTSYLGQYEGDSVLIPSYDILKGIAKGNWAIAQALFRNAAHMYSVKLPDDANEDDFNSAMDATRNINAKSALIWPSTKYEVQQHESGNEMEPEQHYAALFDQVCASHEMTKSVLFGTQAGTVSGSETDIKNYFNKVERYRTNRAEEKITEFLTQTKRMTDSRTSHTFEYEVEIEWGPLFKLDKETRIQAMQNEAQALTTLIGNYALTPDEAREILTAEYVDFELDDLTEKQMDVLDRINLTQSGQGPAALRSEEEYTEGPGGESTSQSAQGGRSGGMEQGQTTASSNPAGASDAAESVTEQLSRLAELHEDGALTDEEFAAAKDAVLSD